MAEKITLTNQLDGEPLTLDVASITSVDPADAGGTRVEISGPTRVDGGSPIGSTWLIKESEEQVQELIARARGG